MHKPPTLPSTILVIAAPSPSVLSTAASVVSCRYNHRMLSVTSWALLIADSWCLPCRCSFNHHEGKGCTHTWHKPQCRQSQMVIHTAVETELTPGGANGRECTQSSVNTPFCNFSARCVTAEVPASIPAWMRGSITASTPDAKC
jgi:hypothetical protein